MEFSVIEQIKRFQDFFYEANYYVKILESARKGEKSIEVDFADLAVFDINLSSELLDDPEEVIQAMEKAIEQFDIDNIVNFRVRIKNIPKSEFVPIRQIKSANIGKFIYTRGTVKTKTDIRPLARLSRFDCPACGSAMVIIQNSNQYREPIQCSCGRKGKFQLLDEDYVDHQIILLEELLSELKGDQQPRSIRLHLQEDLTNPLSDDSTNPGAELTVTGWLKKRYITSKSGAKTTRLELDFFVNHVKSENASMGIKLTEEDIKEINSLDTYKILEKLSSSFIPYIQGNETIKKAALLYLIGCDDYSFEGKDFFGTINILLVGDPGKAKTLFLKSVIKYSPKGVFTTGMGSSGVGLTASVVRSEIDGGWRAEAGAFPRANGGHICVDELDKMNKEERLAINEPLSDGKITINKADQRVVFKARAGAFCAANPKLGRFDPFGLIAEQIDLPPYLFNRFDLIFPMKDEPDKKADEKLAEVMLDFFDCTNQGTIFHPEYTPQFIANYCFYVRENIHPILKKNSKAYDTIKNFFVELRAKSTKNQEGKFSVSISPRQLNTLVRLTIAHSKIRRDNNPNEEDANVAIDLLLAFLDSFGFDKTAGVYDVDRIMTGISLSQREIAEKILQLLRNAPKNEMREEDIVRELRDIEEHKVEEGIMRLRRSSSIFEPRSGLWKLL